MAAYFAYKAANGELTALPPKQPTGKGSFYRQGYKPFAIYLAPPGTKGQWVNIGYLGPFALTAAAVAAAHDALVVNRDASYWTRAKAAAAGVVQGLSNQSFVQNILNMAQVMSGDESYLDRAAANVLRGFIPASGALRSIRQVTDPVNRKPATDWPESLMENIEAQIPGLSKRVPARLNEFGEETKSSRLQFLGLDDRTVAHPALEKELARIGVPISLVGKNPRVEGDVRDLTREQQQQWQKLAGSAIRQGLEQLFADKFEVTVGRGDDRVTDVYSNLNDEQKAKAARSIIRQMKSLGLEELTRRAKAKGETFKVKPKKSLLGFNPPEEEE
jgi:hypothetical protein